MKKKFLAILLTLTTLFTLCFSATLPASAATKVSFGSPSSSSVTVYCNDSVNAKATSTMSVSNYNSKYSYYAVSENNNIATVSGRIKNSKLTITVYGQNEGSTNIKIYAKNSKGQVISNTRTVSVKVMTRSFATPTLRKTGATANSISVAWSVSSKAYVDYYKLEWSTDNFKTYKTENLSLSKSSCKLTGLSKNKTYYIRVVSISNHKNANKYYYHRSKVLKVTTPKW